MKHGRVVVAILGAVALSASAAFAQDFAPTMEFSLSDSKVGANPEVNMIVEQEASAEELVHVTLRVPAGFDLPADEDIPDGEVLGNADLSIDVGPRCAGAPAGSASVPFTARTIIEQDRTDEQSDRGVHAVWVVDLQPVTSIPLEITGSVKKGWQLDGDIPSNPMTCPPLVFDGTIASTSADTGVPIFTNPAAKCTIKPKKKCPPTGPGEYLFSATLSGNSSTVDIEQPITITK